MKTELQERTNDCKDFDSPLDKGIERYVRILCENGIETFESCEGGEGHAFPEPTVRFYGGKAEGYKAVAIALQHDLPVSYLRRVWSIQDGELIGAEWELVFWKKDDYGTPNTYEEQMSEILKNKAYHPLLGSTENLTGKSWERKSK